MQSNIKKERGKNGTLTFLLPFASTDFVYFMHGGIKGLPTRAAAQMYLLEICHTIIAVRWLISRIQAAWTNPLSPPYWSYCKQAETIIQSIESKRSRIELWQLYLSLSLPLCLSLLVQILSCSCFKTITTAAYKGRHAWVSLHLCAEPLTLPTSHASEMQHIPFHPLSSTSICLFLLLPIIPYNICCCRVDTKHQWRSVSLRSSAMHFGWGRK